jgi:hypothetical protein
MSWAGLLEILEEMVVLVRAGDSAEGRISYEVPDESDPEDVDFRVTAVIRYNNREGQGCVRMIGEWPHGVDD